MPVHQSEFKILIVDDSLTNLSIAKTALSNMGKIYTAPSAIKMFELLNIIFPSIILLDINMP
jgi:CheY-like chemotaxis protein